MLLVNNQLSDTLPRRSCGQRGVEQRAHVTLHRSANPALWKIRCQMCDGVLRLQGRVPTYYLKQVAQALLLREFGRELSIDNRLEVLPSTARKGLNESHEVQ